MKKLLCLFAIVPFLTFGCHGSHEGRRVRTHYIVRDHHPHYVHRHRVLRSGHIHHSREIRPIMRRRIHHSRRHEASRRPVGERRGRRHDRRSNITPWHVFRTSVPMPSKAETIFDPFSCIVTMCRNSYDGSNNRYDDYRNDSSYESYESKRNA